MKIKKDTVPAIINASKEELEYIGVTEDIQEQKVQVYDIDKYYGIHGACSGVIVESQIPILKGLGIKSDFIIPTKWLKFV